MKRRLIFGVLVVVMAVLCTLMVTMRHDLGTRTGLIKKLDDGPFQIVHNTIKDRQPEELVNDMFSEWDFAMSDSSGRIMTPGWYGWEMDVFPNMFVVRKLIEETQDEVLKDRLAKKILAKTRDSYDGFASAQADKQATADAAFAATGNAGVAATHPYHVKMATAGMGIYILTEWDRTEALSVLDELSRRPGLKPVSDLYLLYSQYILCEQVRDESLSTDQRALRTAYRTLAAAMTLRVPPRVNKPSWKTAADTRPYKTITGQAAPPKHFYQARPYENIAGLELQLDTLKPHPALADFRAAIAAFIATLPRPAD